VQVGVRLSESGPLTVRWTVPARMVRQRGARGRGPVLIARATARVTKDADAQLTVKLTPVGRRLLRRTRRLRADVTATHVVAGLGTLKTRPLATTLRR
jgi:hypothetical protein